MHEKFLVKQSRLSRSDLSLILRPSGAVLGSRACTGVYTHDSKKYFHLVLYIQENICIFKQLIRQKKYSHE